jgi:hypothetical protein
VPFVFPLRWAAPYDDAGAAHVDFRTATPLIASDSFQQTTRPIDHRELEEQNVRIFTPSTVRQYLLQAFLLFAILAARPLLAAEKVAVISLKAHDELFNDIGFVLKATGTEGISQLFLPQIKGYFKGIDAKRPIGVVLSLDENQLVPLAFVPVTDLKTVLAPLSEQLGEPTDAGDGVLQLQGPQPMFLKQQGAWTFIGQTKESLKELPGQPDQLLEGLNTQYDIAVRAFVQNIPAHFKQMAIGQINSALEQAEGTSEEE